MGRRAERAATRTGRGRAVAGWVALLGCLACSGSPPTGGDADATSDAADDGDLDGRSWEIAPPAPPAPPVFTPCPPGWLEAPDPDTGIVTCDPWPAGGPEDCPLDEAHFPGEAGCVRLGPECSGEWAEDLPGDATVLYVRAGGAAGGTGTRDDPFGTIAEAMARAADGTVIALGQGTYDEEVMLGRGVTLCGACVAGTRLTCSTADFSRGVVNAFQLGTTLRNVRIDGARRGVLVDGSGALHLEDVVISGVRYVGISARGAAAVTGREVVVRDAPEGAFGQEQRGLAASEGATVELTRAAFVNNEGRGVSMGDGSSRLRLTDLAVIGTRVMERDGYGGNGLTVQYGRADVERAALVGNHGSGIWVGLEGEIVLTEAVIEGTRRDGSEISGAGVEFWSPAPTRRLSRVRIADSEGTGLLNLTGNVTASDVLVRDSGAAGVGFWTSQDNSMTRLVVLGTSGGGIGADGSCEEIDGERICGSLLLEDVVVRDSRASPEGYAGHGLTVTAGARVRVVRGLFERNETVGIGAWHEGTELRLEDATIRDTQPDPANGLWGIGLYLEGPARTGGARVALERNRYVGILTGMPGAELELEDLAVADTLPAARPGPGAGGIGVGSYAGAHADLRRFLVTRSALAGVQLAHGALEDGTLAPEGGTVDLHQGEISENPVGVNIQTDPFDLGRLQDDVLYRDNERNLDTSELPVPGTTI